ncbi:hypothetical protein [Gordonia sp. NPDC003429]
MAKNVKLSLTNGRTLEYDEASISVESGGALKVVEETGYVTYYAPAEWRTLGHTSGGTTTYL